MSQGEFKNLKTGNICRFDDYWNTVIIQISLFPIFMKQWT